MTMDYLRLNINLDIIIRFLLILILFVLPVNLFSQNSTKYKVNSIYIKGNDKFSNRTIKKVLNISESTFYKKQRLSKRMILTNKLIIKTFYLKNGFLNATIRDSLFVNKKQNVDVYFFIDEGQQYILKNINFSGNELFSNEELLRQSKIKTGKPYNPIEIQKFLQNIKIKYENKGKPLAIISDSLEIQGNDINLYFKINEHRTMTINNIFLKNNLSVSDMVINRELFFKKYDLYSKKKIEKSKKYLLNLGLFSTVNINYSNIDTNNNEIDMIVYVREQDMRYWEVNTGFVQKEYQGTEIHTNYEISANWRHKNISNKARGLGINTEYGVNLQDLYSPPDFNASMSYMEPWLMGFRSTTLFRLFVEDQQQEEYDYRKYGFETSLIINPDKKNYLKTGFEISGIANKYKDLIDSTDFFNINERERERAIFINFSRDRRNDFLFPSRGHLFSFSAKVTSSILGGTKDYFQFETSYSEYFRLLDILVFAYRWKIGYISPYINGQTAPEYEKYYLGGATSLRGWDNQKFLTKKSQENSEIIADRKSMKVLTNFEVRFPVYWLIGGEIFIDGGNLVSDIQTFQNKKYRWNYGYGLTLKTPLGPVRIDRAKPFDEKEWQYQFAISYAF